MPRIRDPNRDKAYKIYKSYGGNIDLVEIANQLSVPAGTVRGWKAKDKWNDKMNGTFQKNTERSKPKKTGENNDPDGTKTTMMNEELTHEQRLFCIYYSKSFNATQSYLKAYGCSYEVAASNAYRLMENDGVRKEVYRLNEIKRQQIVVNESDMVEFHMRVAFADMGDYVEFGRKTVTEKDTGMEFEVNEIRLYESTHVDTQLIKEISKNDKGAVSIKLLDRCKSLDWLDKYFLMNPMDKHKIEYDNKKLEFEKARLILEQAKVETPEEDEVESDGFMEALKGKVDDIWAE